MGRLNNSSEAKGYGEVGELGQLQRKVTNTPHTKSVHRSGVTAEVVTPTGLTTEQKTIKTQNAIESTAGEFYAKASFKGKLKTKNRKT